MAATDDQARNELWPHYEALMNRIGAERGWQPVNRAHFEREAGPDGALSVGSPDTVGGHAYIHPGGHTMPSDAGALMAKFFKEHTR